MRVIDETMRSYYEARAQEYDDWWLGTGLFTERERPGWHDEVRALLGVLRSLTPARTLDVACGTGFLTRALPGTVTGIDQSAGMVEVAAQRLPQATLLQGEAVPLPFPTGAFERVHTGHFYGHLLAAERDAFLAEARRVGTELVITDSALRDGVDAEQWQERALEDGSTHRVYKRYFTGAALAGELGSGEILMDGRWFVVVAAR